ncbi:MAG: type II toxin-antitoxin system HicB family antitoxin [Patescibacteria group bacterium]
MGRRIVEKVLRYNAIFEPAEEGGFTITVPKLPGVVTEGDTFEQAMERVKDAVEGHLQILQEAGEEIPEPDEKSFTATVDVKLPKQKFAGA